MMRNVVTVSSLTTAKVARVPNATITVEMWFIAPFKDAASLQGSSTGTL